jgi:serine/threonine protein kinase
MNYINHELIGEGTYGSVFLARCRETNVPVALKKIKQQKKEGFPISAVREIKILKILRHPNVITLLNVVKMNDDVYMVLEFCDHDLAGLLEACEGVLTLILSLEHIASS